MDQATAGFGFPVTVAENCAFCTGASVAGDWSMDTPVVPVMSMLSKTAVYGGPKPDETARPASACDDRVTDAVPTCCHEIPSFETKPVSNDPWRLSLIQ